MASRNDMEKTAPQPLFRLPPPQPTPPLLDPIYKPQPPGMVPRPPTQHAPKPTNTFHQPPTDMAPPRASSNSSAANSTRIQTASGNDTSAQASAAPFLGLPFDLRGCFKTPADFRNALLWEFQRSINDETEARRAAGMFTTAQLERLDSTRSSQDSNTQAETRNKNAVKPNGTKWDRVN